jgi:hypothetical protein
VSEQLILLGIVVAAASGAVGLFASRSSTRGQWLTTALAVAGCGLGLAGVGVFWLTADSRPIVLPWAIPGGEFAVAVDGLSASF